MARMTITQAQKAWNLQRPEGMPPDWPSRATIRKWIGDGKVTVEKIKIGERQNGNPIFLTFITDNNPPPPKVQRRTRPKKPKQAALPFPEQNSPPVAGIARSPRRRWPF